MDLGRVGGGVSGGFVGGGGHGGGAGFMASQGMSPSTQMQEGRQVSGTERGVQCVCMYVRVRVCMCLMFQTTWKASCMRHNEGLILSVSNEVILVLHEVIIETHHILM